MEASTEIHIIKLKTTFSFTVLSVIAKNMVNQNDPKWGI